MAANAVATARAGALCAAMALAAGCGAEVSADGADAGVAPGADYAFEFAVHLVDTFAEGQKGSPVGDALVALDLPDGSRRELRTSATGRVELRVPADAEWVTWTAAKPGLFPVTTFYRATLDEIRGQIAADGELYALMEWLPEPVSPGEVQVSVSCPAGCCVSRGLFGWCQPATGSDRVPQSSAPFLLTAFSVDAQGRPLERAETTLPDTLTSQPAAFAFDGGDDTVPILFDLVLRLPSDPASQLAQQGVNTGSGLPVMVNDHSVDRHRGNSFNHRPDLSAGTHTLTVGYFPLADDSLDMDIRAYPRDTPTPHSRWSGAMSGRSFPRVPEGGTYDLVDIPRFSSPVGEATRASRFSWQPVDGAVMYELHVQTAEVLWVHELIDRTLWLAISWSHQDISLPEPPAGYDVADQWGDPPRGEYRAVACDRWLPWSHRRLWYEPRAAAEVGCGFSEAVDGPLY